MRKKTHKKTWLSSGLMALFLVSCGGIDSDAKKAAELTNKSIEQTQEMKLDDAQKSYRQAHKIIEKYKNHQKSEKFNKRYREYRDKDKLPLRAINF
ncbi:MAG: hypothetical protein LBS52_04370 [Dysgonamonadaceae bacterium]|jgi:hypothetical protein|nr:hypothetical protein [Dysgonamonadaceae bacterium]